MGDASVWSSGCRFDAGSVRERSIEDGRIETNGMIKRRFDD